MRILFYLLIITLTATNCELDNFEAPSLILSGRVVDSETGEMIENGGANGGTTIQIYEGNSQQPIISASYPDGHFMNATMFPGSYKVVAIGPFMMVGDGETVSMTQNADVEIKALPNVRLNASLVSMSGTTATVKVEYTKAQNDQVLQELTVVWSTINNPNVFTFYGGGQKNEDVSSQNLTTGEMIFTIEGLDAGSKYFFRAAGRTNAPGNYYNYSKSVSNQ